ncbi:MAG: DUF368 domain-containing protein, partial [Nanoarchaeota archaeon]|nr:DUF368 domain-containing protein [Nanoarchaeota archaeon]
EIIMKGKYSSTFLKGLLMGFCDVIPGISGGTIAFITGIYERLINAIKGFSPDLFYSLILFAIGKESKKVVGEKLNKLDFAFLVTLLLGIAVSLIVFSRVVSFLLDRYFAYTMAFFFGLILASAKTIFDHIERHHTVNTLVMVLGLMAGFSLVFLVPVSVQPSLFYVLIGGFVGISAMVLPGISGAFILLVMGIYRFMLDTIKNFPQNFEYLLMFGVGVLIGVFTISRIVSWLLKKDKSKTLYFLLGLVVGALSVPLRGFVSEGYFTAFSILMYVALFVFGIFFASLIKKLSRR